MYIAAQNGHIDIVRSLLNVTRFDINKTYKFGATALYIASSKGQTDVVELLLHRGARIEDTCDDGCTPSRNLNLRRSGLPKVL